MGKKKRGIAKPYKVRLSENALRNFDEITGYIAFINQQPFNAIKVGDSLFETIDRIEKSPFLFKECELISTKTKMYRQAVCLSWYIIFKIKETEIIILGIIHVSRKPSKITALRKIKE